MGLNIGLKKNIIKMRLTYTPFTKKRNQHLRRPLKNLSDNLQIDLKIVL
jgi:hypothetical protein